MDAYAGSGTSVVVANEMNLQFIAIDKGKHFLKFVLKRLKESKKPILSKDIKIIKI